MVAAAAARQRENDVEMLGPKGVFTGRGVPLVFVMSADHPGSIPGAQPRLDTSFSGSPTGCASWNNLFFEMTTWSLPAPRLAPWPQARRGPGSFHRFNSSILGGRECELLLFLISDLGAWGSWGSQDPPNAWTQKTELISQEILSSSHPCPDACALQCCCGIMSVTPNWLVILFKAPFLLRFRSSV